MAFDAMPQSFWEYLDLLNVDESYRAMAKFFFERHLRRT